MKLSKSAIAGKTFVVTLILTSIPGAAAFWRMPCRVRSGYGRLDPLIAPGKMATHAHAIHGSSGFSASATYDDLIAGECTSCAVEQDKSAYWIPSLYFQDDQGQLTLVNQNGGMLAYYFLNQAPAGGGITAFPKGFTMLAGDQNIRNFTLPVPDPPKSEWVFNAGQLTQEGLAAKAIGFNCLNYAAAAEGTLYRHFLPDQAYLSANCKDGLRLELMFPSCWNGKDVDSDNHKDHVAYPDLVINGDCPTGYEVRLPGLMYETIWDTYAFANKAGRFVLSNGDPTGYGYHGDFMTGWDVDFLQKAVNTCTNGSGQIEDCPIFTVKPDEGSYETCNFTEPTGALFAAYATEDVVGPLANLPGHVQIQDGPDYASNGVATTAAGTGPTTVSYSSHVVPTLSYSAGNTASVAGSYLPGDVFIVQTTIISGYEPAYTVNTTPAPTTPIASDPTPYTTVYKANSAEVIEMILYEETVTVSDLTATTLSATAKASAVSARKRHMQQHGHRHRVRE